MYVHVHVCMLTFREDKLVIAKTDINLKFLIIKSQDARRMLVMTLTFVESDTTYMQTQWFMFQLNFPTLILPM